MSADSHRHSRFSIRVPNELKQTIEEAAAVLGLTVNEFTVSTVVREAREVLQQDKITRLSNRDRDAFLIALNDVNARPNRALRTAAHRYRRRLK